MYCVLGKQEEEVKSHQNVGINFRNARIADNEGNQPMQTSVVENGPEAYFTMLPVFRMVEKMKENGIPASVSYTAVLMFVTM